MLCGIWHRLLSVGVVIVSMRLLRSWQGCFTGGAETEPAFPAPLAFNDEELVAKGEISSRSVSRVRGVPSRAERAGGIIGRRLNYGAKNISFQC